MVLEHLSTKKRDVFRFLLILGIMIIFGGVIVVVHGYFVHEMASSNSSLKSIPRNQDTTPTTIPAGSLISVVDITYQTNDGILSANYPFNYTITAIVNNPNNIDKIEAYPWTVIDGMALPTTNSIMSDKKNGIVQEDHITLNRIPDYNAFNGSGINYVVSTERNIGFFLMPYTNGTARGGIFIDQADPLIIRPQVDELQAQTDRDIQKQDIESAESNAYVIGLTMVIIGSIPIGVAMEFVVHGWLLREDTKSDSNFSKLDENPNYYHDG